MRAGFVSSASACSGAGKSPTAAFLIHLENTAVEQRSWFHFKNMYLVSALKSEFVRRVCKYLPLLPVRDYTDGSHASPLCSVPCAVFAGRMCVSSYWSLHL